MIVKLNKAQVIDGKYRVKGEVVNTNASGDYEVLKTNDQLKAESLSAQERVKPVKPIKPKPDAVK